MSASASLRSAHGAFTTAYQEIDDFRETLAKVDAEITTPKDFATMQGITLGIMHMLAIGLRDLRLATEQAIEAVDAMQNPPPGKSDAPDSTQSGD